jgi:integrase
LEAVQKLYDRSGVKVPVAESGKTMPWHSLRHIFGTELAAQSVPIPTIGRLMGHADVKTTGQLDEAIARVFGAPVAPLGQQVGSLGLSNLIPDDEL